MSPAPSPANSENDLNKISSNTLSKKKQKPRKKSIRKKGRDRSPTNDREEVASPQTPADPASDCSSMERASSLKTHKHTGMPNRPLVKARS